MYIGCISLWSRWCVTCLDMLILLYEKLFLKTPSNSENHESIVLCDYINWIIIWIYTSDSQNWASILWIFLPPASASTKNMERLQTEIKVSTMLMFNSKISSCFLMQIQICSKAYTYLDQPLFHTLRNFSVDTKNFDLQIEEIFPGIF